MIASQLEKNPLIHRWLRLKRSENTKYDYLLKISAFLEHFNLTPEELKDMEPKEVRELCLVYQNDMRAKLANNTILGGLTAVSSFMSHWDKEINWKRNTKVKPKPDVSSHVFSNGDLSAMFKVGNIRDKAIIALATSLGWEISGFVDLKREKTIKLIERAEETGQKFVYFRDIRQKTGEPRLGILNPLALNGLESGSENLNSRKRDQRTEPNLYSMHTLGFLTFLTILEEESIIELRYWHGELE
jgi:hypothetical protein